MGRCARYQVCSALLLLRRYPPWGQGEANLLVEAPIPAGCPQQAAAEPRPTPPAPAHGHAT